MRWAWRKYLKGSDTLPDEQKKYARLLSTDCAGLPCTYVDVGTEDYFHEECAHLMRNLEAAGVPLTKAIWEGMPHGFEKGGERPRGVEQEALQKRRVWWQGVLNGKRVLYLPNGQ
ncbi:hypothetical protein F4821DRAFT_214671 [Hypoxylon rubiginosum]|uniref:Uncharacterized protein n=1 Tax=Hypoxylon rubiginosum TaxID=110542 RepID=A0ACC0CPK5_9PEZI|nr:hypothetical protein F4821DRAFT_214671 [Hypoxylon rubiginosum]